MSSASMASIPAMSIVIPVLHEADRINGLLYHIRGINGSEDVEIIVVDGDPAGGTIRKIADRNVIKAMSEPGRAVQMNKGASLASGCILLFLHADTFLPTEAFSLVRRAMRGGTAVGGAFDLGFKTTNKIFKITECYAAVRTRLTGIPFGDQAIFIKRDYFNKIGRFRNIPIMEDVELMGRIKKSGDGICIIPRKVMTSPRRYEKDGILHVTLRNLLLQILYYMGVSPERLARWYGA